jgi:hypothetical protein
MKSKSIYTVYLLGMMAISIHAAIAGDLPDTYGNRLVAGERYLNVVSMKDIMRDMILETAKNLPEKVRGVYIALMNKHIDVAMLERVTLASMAKHFTVDELNALADFYSSKEGRSAMKKFGAYMADIMPVLNQEMGRAQMEIKADIERLIKK